MEVFESIRSGCEVFRFDLDWNVQVPFISATTTEDTGELKSPWFTPFETPGCQWNLTVIDQDKTVCIRPSLNILSEEHRSVSGPVLIKMIILNRKGEKVLWQMRTINETDWSHANFYFAKEKILQSLCQQTDGSFTFSCDVRCQVKKEYCTPTDIECRDGVSADFEKLFESKASSDVKFLIRGREFPAHKLILDARCKHLAEMFDSKLEDGLSPEVTFNNIEPEVFYQILRFIYTGHVPLEILNTMATALFFAAKKYKLEELESECRKHLFRFMSPFDCAELLLRSSLISNDDLKKVAKIFWRYPNQVLESTTWQMTSKENGDLTKAVLLFLVNTK